MQLWHNDSLPPARCRQLSERIAHHPCDLFRLSILDSAHMKRYDIRKSEEKARAHWFFTGQIQYEGREKSPSPYLELFYASGYTGINAVREAEKDWDQDQVKQLETFEGGYWVTRSKKPVLAIETKGS